MIFKRWLKDLAGGVKSVFAGPATADNLFSLDGRAPFSKALLFGGQHILAMFASNVAPIIIVFSAIGLNDTPFAAHAMMGAFLLAALGTILHLLIGARLPIVAGTSFAFVPILIAIGNGAGGGEAGYYTIMGALIVGGLVSMVMAFFYRFWRKIIKPIVPAVIILGLGLSLLSSSANSFFGGSTLISNIILNGETGTGVPYFAYILVALATLIVCLIWPLFFKGVWRNVNFLVGIIFGFALACCIPGMVDFSRMAVDGSQLVGPRGIIDYPRFLDLTALRFDPAACALTSLCYLITIMECTSCTAVLTNGPLGREPTKRELLGTAELVGPIGIIGALFGAFPLTMFSQNITIVTKSKSPNRYCIFVGACLLFIVGFFPPITNFVFAVPDVVMGGVLVALLGSIAVIGMQEIARLGFTEKNITILAISLAIGFGLTVATVDLPSGILANSTSLFGALGVQWLAYSLASPVLNMFVISFILSWVLPDEMHIGSKKKE